MDWEALRKLRASRIYDEQSFKLHRPLTSRHRADKALQHVEATAAAVESDGSQFPRAGLSGKPD